MEGRPRPPRWSVIVLRAWAEAGGVRIRVLGHDSSGHEAQVLVVTPEEAGRVVAAWLADLVADLPLDPGRGREG